LAGKYGDRFLPLSLDVTDRAQAFAAVGRAADAFGRLDVVARLPVPDSREGLPRPAGHLGTSWRDLAESA
jgi:alkanesulfonate monooxygenase SsuD/methylene tetrahydromethanopterin reductase-like flavin-dependent oxidoreductase (luciferase family)